MVYSPLPCTHTHTHARTHTHTHIHTETRTHARTHTQRHARTHRHTHKHTETRTHTHTHTHTHTDCSCHRKGNYCSLKKDDKDSSLVLSHRVTLTDGALVAGAVPRCRSAALSNIQTCHSAGSRPENTRSTHISWPLPQYDHNHIYTPAEFELQKLRTW